MRIKIAKFGHFGIRHLRVLSGVLPNARLLDQFIWMIQQTINLDTCRLSSWPLRWRYNVAYPGFIRQTGSHLHVVHSVWEALIQCATLASLQPCWLVLCPVTLASHLGCQILWYLDLLTMEAGLAHPAFCQRMACIFNLPWSVVISYPRWWHIHLYSPFGCCFLNNIWALSSLFLIRLWYACILF